MRGEGVDTLRWLRGGEVEEVRPSQEFGRAALRADEPLAPRHWLGFWHESRHFIDCLKAGEQPSSRFGDAVKTMELVERIRLGV